MRAIITMLPIYERESPFKSLARVEIQKPKLQNFGSIRTLSNNVALFWGFLSQLDFPPNFVSISTGFPGFS
jgi:hypothetical protein